MLTKILSQQRLLVLSGLAFAVLATILVVAAAIDPTEITGVGRWIKPLKFAISIAVYLWTLAVYLVLIDGADAAKRLIARGSSLLMFGEIVLILIQATRGVRSHFNIETAFDTAVFATMGIMITVSTMLAVYLLVLLFRERVEAPRAVVWALRLGILTMIAASLEGGYMSQHLAHSVGVADGGAGLPLVNWSTSGGDLRIAHFIGLHGMQAIPLFALIADRVRPAASVALTVAFSGGYFAAVTFVFAQALLGRPLF